MIDIARQFDLFVVADEIYSGLVYNGHEYEPLSNLIGDVPGISLQGISKEMPWPGARCGWMEVYNQSEHPMFRTYIDSIINAKMLEVCSTTLPQAVIPRIYSHPEWPGWLEKRKAFFMSRGNMIADLLSGCPGIIVNPTAGAFYSSIVFKEGINDSMRLKINDPKVRAYIDSLCSDGIEPDRRFVYELLGSRSICTVPLSSFVTDLQGFRCTLLERDDERFQSIYTMLGEALCEFMNSEMARA